MVTVDASSVLDQLLQPRVPNEEGVDNVRDLLG